MTPDGSLDAYWHELVTASLLGTDRRDPPRPPDGPVADLVADTVRPDAASQMLATVAAVATSRRAGFVPGPPADPLQEPDSDERAWCSPEAVATWRAVVADWPVLEDEWVLTVLDRGLRLPPDVLVELLLRHRGDAVRRARVLLAGGPLGEWLVDHVPELAATTGSAATRRASAEAVASLPQLPVPPEFGELLRADAHTVVTELVAGFDHGEFGAPHRAVLVNLVARCRPAVLVDAARALERTGAGQALALADLARLRHRMLVELGVSP